MVFQKKGGSATKRNFPQVKEKVPKKKTFQEEDDDDDSDDDDVDVEDVSDFDDSDSDASDSGGASGKLNAKGKQTPTQGKGSSLIKTPRGQAQTPVPSSGKKNQLQQKQIKMEPGMKGQGNRKILDKEAIEVDDSDDDDGDDDDDDDDTSDSGDAGGKLNTKGKQTPSQGRGVSLIKTPKGQAQRPPISSGKKNQLATPLQKQTKQTVMKEFPGMKGSAGKGKIVGKGSDDEEEDDDDDEDEDSDDDDDDSDEVNTKTPSALDKSTGKKTPNDKKGMHVSFELPKKGSPAKTLQSPQNIPALAKKNQQAAAVSGALQGKSAKQNTPKGAPGKEVQKGKKKADSDDDDDIDEDDDLSDDDDDESDDDDDEDDDDDVDSDDDDEEAIKKKVASLKKEMLPKKEKKPLNESNKSQDPKSKKAKTLVSSFSKGESKPNNPVPNTAFQESFDKEAERKRERDARNLFIRGLPLDITIEEIKALSPDILDVSLPKTKYQKRKSNKSFFGFLEFANEKKADENYVKLQNKKLRGQEVYIDYSGEKSKNRNVATVGSTMNEKNINKKKLFVTGLPVDATMAEVAQLFPGCYTITLNNAPEYRNCNASFHTEEGAAEAFKANGNASVRGRAVTVLYAIEPHKSQFKRKQPYFERNKFSQSNKRIKTEM